MREKCYIAIDLKSFYASAEAVQRGLDPLSVNLVVADGTRSDKTICLAVSPALKAYGIPGRGRLFEVEAEVKKINEERRWKAPGHRLRGKSADRYELMRNPSLALDYITAAPQMAKYLDTSARILRIYLRHVDQCDLHVYSIDEVFIDATDYLDTLTAEEFARSLINEVLKETGITATAGIGSNLYLAKVAMDILAKKKEADENGVRIASLDERSYRTLLWSHQPLSDFWRIGPGIERKLNMHSLYTMGDIARCSNRSEELLYRLFGINAELLIDHAWGYESCTMEDIKHYRPRENSLSSGQVLQKPYTYEMGLTVVKEMADELAFALLGKGLECNQLVLTVSYDTMNIRNTFLGEAYQGKVAYDWYGRAYPVHSHGSVDIGRYTSSSSLLILSATKLYEEITAEELLIRRINLTACHVVDELRAMNYGWQLDLFEAESDRMALEEKLKSEKQLQHSALFIRERFGKGAIMRGTSFEEGATGRERAFQIGGHRA